MSQRDTQVASLDQQAAKRHAQIAYVLMIAGLFTGVCWLLGAMWAMIKNGDAKGTIFTTHYANMIKVFWLSFFFALIGLILQFLYIGYLVLFAVWLWSLYHMVKGLTAINSNRSYPS